MSLCTHDLVRMTLLHGILLHYRFQKFSYFGALQSFAFCDKLHTFNFCCLFEKMLPIQEWQRTWKNERRNEWINKWMNELLYLFKLNTVKSYIQQIIYPMLQGIWLIKVIQFSQKKSLVLLFDLIRLTLCLFSNPYHTQNFSFLILYMWCFARFGTICKSLQLY